MARGFLLPTLILLIGLPSVGQIVFGPNIGYPGGGYPGRRNRGNQGPVSQPNNEPSSSSLTGIVRKIDDKDVIIESDNQTITTVSTAGSTKYSDASGGSAKIGDFQPGDHVRITADEDKNGKYKAKSIAMIKEGTLEEHASASQATDDPTRPITKPSADSSTASSDSSSSADRPKLRRATSSSDDSSSPSSSDDSDRPKLRRAPSSSDSAPATTASNSAPSSDSDAPPRIRRAVSSPDDDAPKAQIDPSSSATIAPRRPSSQSSSSASSAPASTRDSDDDPGPPKLRRATPPADASPEVADARPSLHADDAGGVTRLPPPPAEDTSSGGGGSSRFPSTGDPFIERTREAAFSFSETLPDYVVKQYTTRYATALARRGGTSWQVLDNVTADVIEENGVEKYKNILVNGKPPRENVEDSGSWSDGEFSSLLQDVMSSSTNADFHGKRPVTIVNRPAFRYDYSVSQANSHWVVESRGQKISPAYTGAIWIDKETYRVLRVELSAQNMPRDFPLDTVESAVDYDFVPIGEGKYLLPVHAEALSCGRGTNDCTRNVIEFRNYRKFAADTNITFDTPN